MSHTSQLHLSQTQPPDTAESTLIPPDGHNLQSNTQGLAGLKRWISALEAENAQLLQHVSKSKVQSYAKKGRVIRRLVTIVEPISDMVAEHDRRELLLLEDRITSEMISSNSTPNQERTYANFIKLLEWCPTLRKALDAGEPDTFVYRELQAGADAARADDASMLKREIIHWLETNISIRPEPPLCNRNKQGRGFNHLTTGQLLCPVDYDWADEGVRQSIREYDPEFRVTAYSWPSYLYPHGMYDPRQPSKGLFEGELLVRSFKCIFTSPNSARHMAGAQTTPLTRTQQSRNHVAALLGMKSVQPRAIAYVAVQLRFALSSSNSWAVEDEDFNYEEFYYNIVDYFEAPASDRKSLEIKKLLLWWNRMVFGRRNVTEYCPMPAEQLSVARSRK